MPAFVLAPLILAAVLALSGWAKSRAVGSTRSVLRQLRMPAPLQAAWVARALPWGELALAAFVVLAPGGVPQQLAAVLTVLLMVTYWVVVARAMTFDPRPSCGCFGEIGDQRITSRTLARNTVLVLLAGAYLGWAAGGASVLGTLTDGWEPVAWVLGAAAAALVTWFVAARPGAAGTSPAPATPQPPRAQVDTATVHEAAEADDGLDYIRAPIPLTLLTDPAGDNHTLHEMVLEKAQLLIFVNCYCGTTTRVQQAWAGYRERLPQLDVRLVFSGVRPLSVAEGVDVSEAWSDHGGVAARALDLAGSPTAVLLGADGQLAGGPVVGNDEVDSFVEEIAEALSEVPTA